ncbi:MAG: PRC-barrel domain-containing protein [Beijerinckiaceae bacterium]
MNRLALVLTVAAVSAFGASAMAQTNPPSPTAPSTTTPATPAPMTPAPMTTTPSLVPGNPVAPDPYYTAPMTSAHWRSTELVGKPVYTRQDERIGDIDELVMNADGRVVAAIIGVGGFLGMGERKVAVAFPTLKMVRDINGAGRISVDLSKESLTAAPVYTAAKTN